MTDGPGAEGSISPPFVSVFLKQQHFTYIDEAATLGIWDAWYDGPSNGWNLQQINCGNNSTCLVKNPNARPDGPQNGTNNAVFVAVFFQQQHFAWSAYPLGPITGAIWDAWYDGPSNSWNLQKISH